MKTPEGLQIAARYACYRPMGTVSLQEGIDLVGEAIAFARVNKIKRLLVDTTKLTGFKSPDTWERFLMAVRFAEEASSSVAVSLVAKAEHIDPDRFGITVARNRGLLSNVFTTEAEALEWLLQPFLK